MEFTGPTRFLDVRTSELPPKGLPVTVTVTPSQVCVCFWDVKHLKVMVTPFFK